MSNREQTRKLVVLALLAGVSVVLVYFIRIPLIPLVPFLEYDPADIPIFIGALAYGPLAGVLLTVVVSVVQGLTVSAATRRAVLWHYHAYYRYLYHGDGGLFCLPYSAY